MKAGESHSCKEIPRGASAAIAYSSMGLIMLCIYGSLHFATTDNDLGLACCMAGLFFFWILAGYVAIRRQQAIWKWRDELSERVCAEQALLQELGMGLRGSVHYFTEDGGTGRQIRGIRIIGVEVGGTVPARVSFCLEGKVFDEANSIQIDPGVPLELPLAALGVKVEARDAEGDRYSEGMAHVVVRWL